MRGISATQNKIVSETEATPALVVGIYLPQPAPVDSTLSPRACAPHCVRVLHSIIAHPWRSSSGLNINLDTHMQTKVFRGVETTTYTDDNGALCGVYRGTTVAKKLEPSGKVILNSGGWMTNTTKNRMNQFAASYCHNRFGVIQRDGAWFVVYYQGGTWDEANKIPFTDNMEV